MLARLAEAEGDAAIAAVTWHELRYGVARLDPGRRRDALETFARALPTRYPVLSYDRKAAGWHAHEHACLERAGTVPSFADGQIAATAATHGLVLVTRNVWDFEDFDGIDIESWWDDA